jgi:hypothetical protein
MTWYLLSLHWKPRLDNMLGSHFEKLQMKFQLYGRSVSTAGNISLVILAHSNSNKLS